MVRLLAQLAISMLANAFGLILANVLLDGLSLTATGLIVATIIFSLTTVVLGPLITKIALTNAQFLMGGIALITTFVGLLITTFFTDGLTISGLSTWVAATVIVWLFAVIAQVILPLLLFKKVLSKNK